MVNTVSSIYPKWISEIVEGSRNKMSRKQHASLDNIVVTIEAVSCMEAFKVYDELMDCSFFVGNSTNSFIFRLKEFLYVGPDGAQFSIACKLIVRND